MLREERSNVMRALLVAVGLTVVGAVFASGCCPLCRKTPEETPAPQATRVESQGVSQQMPQTTCPVMGGKINKALYVDYGGKRVYACCPGCIPKLKKNPAGYIKKLEAAGVTLGKAPGK